MNIIGCMFVSICPNNWCWPFIERTYKFSKNKLFILQWNANETCPPIMQIDFLISCWGFTSTKRHEKSVSIKTDEIIFSITIYLLGYFPRIGANYRVLGLWSRTKKKIGSQIELLQCKI